MQRCALLPHSGCNGDENGEDDDDDDDEVDDDEDDVDDGDDGDDDAKNRATNVSVSGSYVAVVSRPRRKVPCPISVCAYVPIISVFHALPTHFNCCCKFPCFLNKKI